MTALLVEYLKWFTLLKQTPLNGMTAPGPYGCLHLVKVGVRVNVVDIQCISACFSDFGHFFAKVTASFPFAELLTPDRWSRMRRVICFHSRRGRFGGVPREI